MSDFECQSPEVYCLDANESAILKDHPYAKKERQFTSSPVKTFGQLSEIDISQINESIGADDSKDPDYTVSDTINTGDGDDSDDIGRNSEVERKYVVYESQIELLMSLITCKECDVGMEVAGKNIIGTNLHMQLKCFKCESMLDWNSQPLLGKLPAFNLLLATSIFCSGTPFYYV